MIQYRVVIGKKDERVEGPDDAALVITVPLADARNDPAVAFMQGRLKTTGPTGLLFAGLASGEITRVLSRMSAVEAP
jgi:hypothetical protein